MLLKQGIRWLCDYHHQHNEAIHTTDSMTVMSLSARLHNISMATERLCLIALKQNRVKGELPLPVYENYGMQTVISGQMPFVLTQQNCSGNSHSI